MRLQSFLLATAFCTSSLASYAQDLHSSQPTLAEVHFNPASAGMFQGTLRVAARHRAQWIQVPVNYHTYAVEADKPLLEKGSTRLSAAVRVAHDAVGDGQLNYNRAGLGISGIQRLSPFIVLGIGADLSFAQRSVDLGGLSFKNQWTGDVFDPSAPNKEPLGPRTGLIPLLNVGFTTRLGSVETPRTGVQLGFAAHQVNRPVVSFQGDKSSQLATRFIAHAHGSVQIHPFLDAIAFTQWQNQNPYRSLLAGAGVRAIIARDGDFYRAIQFSVATRAGDSVIPTIQLEWGSWTTGFSYDINTSPFQVATQQRGGWELACVYRIVPVPPVPEFKSCPVF
jgi:type IX secretion system PorP/SprF family membrane protein